MNGAHHLDPRASYRIVPTLSTRVHSRLAERVALVVPGQMLLGRRMRTEKFEGCTELAVKGAFFLFFGASEPQSDSPRV